jgi:NADPH2:quinone reductase
MATNARAVRFDRYGDRDVLYVDNVVVRDPGPGEVLVLVRAAGINPGESNIRSGALQDRFPATFPSGQGSDVAGIVLAVGSGVTNTKVGNEIIGWSWERSSHATHVVIPETQLVPKPAELEWTVAGALYVAACTAWAAVAAVDPQPGETVAVSAAAGGVGSLVVQLLTLRRVRVLGIASPASAPWLKVHGVVPIAYGDDLEAKLTAAAPDGIDAFIDTFGPDYVQLAVDLAIAPNRINTIIAFEKAAEVGAKTDGSMAGSTTEILAAVADLLAEELVDLDIAAIYPLDQVQEAFAELEKHHTHGKIVLVP